MKFNDEFSEILTSLRQISSGMFAQRTNLSRYFQRIVTPPSEKRSFRANLELAAVFRAGDGTTTSRDHVRNVSHPRGPKFRRKAIEL